MAQSGWLLHFDPMDGGWFTTRAGRPLGWISQDDGSDHGGRFWDSLGGIVVTYVTTQEEPDQPEAVGLWMLSIKRGHIRPSSCTIRFLGYLGLPRRVVQNFRVTEAWVA